MSFNDSDWENIDGGEAAPAPHSSVHWLTLAAGVVIGASAATLVLLAAPGPRHDAPPQAPALLAANGASQPAAPEVRVPAASPPASAVSPAEPVIAAASVVAAASAANGAEAAKRKARAWARYYHRPAECEGNPTSDQLIACANDFIRSKREFDERWRAGLP
jgi:hypothetical protein